MQRSGSNVMYRDRFVIPASLHQGSSVPPAFIRDLFPIPYPISFSCPLDSTRVPARYSEKFPQGPPYPDSFPPLPLSLLLPPLPLAFLPPSCPHPNDLPLPFFIVCALPWPSWYLIHAHFRSKVTSAPSLLFSVPRPVRSLILDFLDPPWLPAPPIVVPPLPVHPYGLVLYILSLAPSSWCFSSSDPTDLTHGHALLVWPLYSFLLDAMSTVGEALLQHSIV